MGLLQHGTRHSAQSHFTLHTFRRSCRGPLTTARGPAMTDTGKKVREKNGNGEFEKARVDAGSRADAPLCTRPNRAERWGEAGGSRPAA